MWFEPYLGDRFWALLEQPRSRLPRLLSDLLISSGRAGRSPLPAAGDGRSADAAQRRHGDRRAARSQVVPGGPARCGPVASVAAGPPDVELHQDIACLASLDDEGWAALGDEPVLPILITASNVGAERKASLLGAVAGGGAVGPRVAGRSCWRPVGTRSGARHCLQTVLNKIQRPRRGAHGRLRPVACRIRGPDRRSGQAPGHPGRYRDGRPDGHGGRPVLLAAVDPLRCHAGGAAGRGPGRHPGFRRPPQGSPAGEPGQRLGYQPRPARSGWSACWGWSMRCGQTCCWRPRTRRRGFAPPPCDFWAVPVVRRCNSNSVSPWRTRTLASRPTPSRRSMKPAGPIGSG